MVQAGMLRVLGGMLEGQRNLKGKGKRSNFKLGSRLCGVLDVRIRAATLGGPWTTMDGRDLGPDQRSSTRIRGAVVDDRCGRVGRGDL